LVDLLSGDQSLSSNIFFLCHGDDRGILLPELHPDLEKDQPYHAALTAADIAEFVRVPGRVIINTGCATGTRALCALHRKI